MISVSPKNRMFFPARNPISGYVKLKVIQAKYLLLNLQVKLFSLKNEKKDTNVIINCLLSYKSEQLWSEPILKQILLNNWTKLNQL